MSDERAEVGLSQIDDFLFVTKVAFFIKTNIHFQYYVIMLFVGSKFTIFEGYYSNKCGYSTFCLLGVQVGRHTTTLVCIYLKETA